MNSRISSIPISVLMVATSFAHAELYDRGNGLIYDDVLDVTFLQDANLAATETFGVQGIEADGRMDWFTAEEWIAAMNAAGYKGYSDWRQILVEEDDSSCSDTLVVPGLVGFWYGYNCTAPEFGHLFNLTLDNPNGLDDSCDPGCLGNTGPFLNLQSGIYWTGEFFLLSAQLGGGTQYFRFDTRAGYQETPISGDWDKYYIWPARSGDVMPNCDNARYDADSRILFVPCVETPSGDVYEVELRQPFNIIRIEPVE